MADRLGVKQAAVSHWCTGQRAPDTENLPSIAQLLGVRVAWLAFGEGAMTDEADAPKPLRAKPPKRRRAPPASAAPRHPRARNAA